MTQTTYTFRKKPIEIQAWHWRFSTEQAEEPVWIRDALHRWPQLGSIAFEPHHPDGPRIAIATLEGVMTANPGDWIILGTAGEVYPCKPDVFETVYEPVREPTSPGRWLRNLPTIGEPLRARLARHTNASKP